MQVLPPKKDQNAMTLNYSVSENDLLEIRNKIFLKNSIPALRENGVGQSPFSTARFRKNTEGLRFAPIPSIFYSNYQ